MKNLLKVTLLAFTLVFAGNQLEAQTKIGGGVTYSLEDGIGIGVNARVGFGITEQIEIVPNVNYFFPEIGSVMGVNVDGQYNIAAGDALQVYPLAGLNYTRVSQNNFNSGKFGLNVGGGVALGLSDNFDLFSEVKYIVGDVSQLAITAGILIGL